ncbi:hypothetical protein YC2023_009713 [Brassica napus]
MFWGSEHARAYRCRRLTFISLLASPLMLLRVLPVSFDIHADLGFCFALVGSLLEKSDGSSGDLASSGFTGLSVFTAHVGEVWPVPPFDVSEDLFWLVWLSGEFGVCVLGVWWCRHESVFSELQWVFLPWWRPLSPRMQVGDDFKCSGVSLLQTLIVFVARLVMLTSQHCMGPIGAPIANCCEWSFVASDSLSLASGGGLRLGYLVDWRFAKMCGNVS